MRPRQRVLGPDRGPAGVLAKPADVPVLDRRRVVTGRGSRPFANAGRAPVRYLGWGLHRRRPRSGHGRAVQPGRWLPGVAGLVTGRPVATDHHRSGAVPRGRPARNAGPVPTGCPRSGRRTRSSSSTAGGSSNAGRMTSCSPRTGCTRGCTRHSSRRRQRYGRSWENRYAGFACAEVTSQSPAAPPRPLSGAGPACRRRSSRSALDPARGTSAAPGRRRKASVQVPRIRRQRRPRCTRCR